MVDYGNLGWGFYLTFAYVVTGISLAAYGWRVMRRRRCDAEALDAEGFLEGSASTHVRGQGEL